MRLAGSSAAPLDRQLSHWSHPSISNSVSLTFSFPSSSFFSVNSSSCAQGWLGAPVALLATLSGLEKGYEYLKLSVWGLLH